MRPPWSGLRRKVSPIVLGRQFCTGCGRWRPVHDFAIRADTGRLRARCLACQRIYQRKWWSEMTPERRTLRFEYNRILREGQRRQLGMRVNKRSTVIDRVERVTLDRVPLIKAMNNWIARERYNGIGFEQLAIRAGVNSRTIRRIYTGESRHVRIDVADRIAVAIDVPLAVIYPP